MPRINSVRSRQLTVAAPDQSVERVIARLGSLPVATYAATSADFILSANLEPKSVDSLILQPDGKILVGGQFSQFNGVTRNRLVRLNADGTEDTAFNDNLGTGFTYNSFNPGRVRTICVQSDGKILVGGYFQFVNGVFNTPSHLARLNADGTRDATFGPNLQFINTTVFAIAVESDGRIVIGGLFTKVHSGSSAQDRIGIAWIDSSGQQQSAPYLAIPNRSMASVIALAVEPDGKILVGGSFTSIRFDQLRNRLVRLNADGTEDTAFYTNLGTAFNGEVRAITLQSDGKILVGGSFDIFNGNSRRHLVRLNTDGTEDTAFYTNLGTPFFTDLATSSVDAIALQSDGKILVGGNFTSFNGNTRNRLVRLNSDGTEDAGFYTNLGTGFNNTVLAITVQSDGKILVGGQFTTFNGNTRGGLVRLNTDGTESSTINSVDEGSILTVTMTTANIPNGTRLRWRILDRPDDFAINTGAVTVSSNTATFTVTPIADLLTEGPETFRVEISKLTGTVLATSSAVTINDTSFQ